MVCNDFYLQDQNGSLLFRDPTRVGKRLLLAPSDNCIIWGSIGCLVPGREAQLFLFDRLFTHFEKEENITNLRGKLEDDLFRIHEILKQVTSQSIVIMNESFTSTTLRDAIFLSQMVLEKIMQFDLLCVCVTFIDELASLSEATVSMVSTVVPENPASRTYKIERRPADGLSYAISIAEKYQLTYSSLKERIVMKAFLMYRDRDFDLQQEYPLQEKALRQDLELDTLFDAMAIGDQVLLEVAKKAILDQAQAISAHPLSPRYPSGLSEQFFDCPGHLRYRGGFDRKRKNRVLEFAPRFSGYDPPSIDRGVADVCRRA